MEVTFKMETSESQAILATIQKQMDTSYKLQCLNANVENYRTKSDIVESVCQSKPLAEIASFLKQTFADMMGKGKGKSQIIAIPAEKLKAVVVAILGKLGVQIPDEEDENSSTTHAECEPEQTDGDKAKSDLHITKD